MDLRELKKEEKNYTYSRSHEEERVLPCIGHLRGDFGSSGNEFYSTWFEHTPELKTQEFSKEIDKVINDLRFGNEYGKFMSGRSAMAEYCYSHPDSRFDGNYSTEYGFRADTEKYSFLFRLNLNRGEYNFYCYCYEKESLDKHLEGIGKLSEKANFLNDFFMAQKINLDVIEKNGHLVAKDDEGNKWQDAEIYDFALNECLAFNKDGALPFGFGAAESYVEQLKADAKDFGVEITSFVNDKKAVNLSDIKGITLVDLNKASVDFMGIENRRFMYHPSGMLVLGAEDTCLGENFYSHSEEFYEVCKMHEHELPPFDDFIRGWIGVGGGYDNGIIHFAPNIISDNIPMFDKAFSFIEAALENGFSKEACLRGFGNKWEQKISEALGEEGRRDKANSLQDRIDLAKEKSGKVTAKSSKEPEMEY